MAELKPPFGDVAVNVPEALVDRYLRGGWTRVKPSRSSPAKKPARGKKNAAEE